MALIKGRDVFAILPMGFGKSLFYACLPVAQIVASSLKVHSIAGKLDDPVLLNLAVRMHA